MIVTINKVEVKISVTRHANYWVGATFTHPDGKKTYGEYQSTKEAFDRAKVIGEKYAEQILRSSIPNG